MENEVLEVAEAVASEPAMPATKKVIFIAAVALTGGLAAVGVVLYRRYRAKKNAKPAEAKEKAHE